MLKVFFTASYRSKDKYQIFYDAVIKKLKSLDCEVYSLENCESNVSDPLEKELFIRNAIKVCDACVFEISGDTFQLGYEVALISQYNLPTLCLSNNRDYQKIINSSNIDFCKYKDIAELETKIDVFIQNILHKANKNRLNITVQSTAKIKLTKYCKSKNISFSQAINDLVESSIPLD